MQCMKNQLIDKDQELKWLMEENHRLKLENK